MSRAWVFQANPATLVEHRERHRTDYSLLVGPNPSLGRLMERAHGHAVAVLSARQLAGICRQHARAPQGLTEYRALFEQRGQVDTTELDELVDDTTRLSRLAGAICRILADRCPAFGRLTARDLWLMLTTSESGDSTTADEIQELLDMLSHRLVAAVQGSSAAGYVLATDLSVTQSRLALLGAHLAAGTA
jgi:hypothetical protein